jgi:hypothetical protein
MMATTQPSIQSVLRERSESPRETLYTPGVVRRLLHELPHLLDPGLGPQILFELVKSSGNGKKPAPWARFENAVCVHADITQALKALPFFTRQAVYRHYVLGQSRQELATVLRADRETITRHCVDGTEYMAHLLGYRRLTTGSIVDQEPRPKSETVWRNPKLDAGA